MAVERSTTKPRLGGIIRGNRDKFLFLLYVLLISFQFAMSFAGTELSILGRLGLLAMLFLSLIINPKWLPFVLTLFWGTSLLSPLPFLPTETYYLFIFTVAVWLLNYSYGNGNRKIKPVIFITVFYFLMMAAITIEPALEYTSPLFLIIPIALAVSSFVNEEDDIHRLLFALMLMSLYLACLYLLKKEDFSEQYKSFGIERMGWINANMFGGCIGVGLVSAVGYCLNGFKLKRDLIVTIVAISTIILSIPVLIINASRGSLFAAIVTSVLLLIKSKVKLPIRIIVTIIIVFFTVYLYNSGIFELLETRIGEENFETAGNRTLIWKAKFDAFRDCGLLSWIFGVGQPRLRHLGVFYSTHNDYVTAIIGYGVIGFILFMYLLSLPFIMAKDCKLDVFIFTIFLIVEGMVLEPFFRGILPFYMYYILLYKYAFLYRKRYILRS